jgi:hypothetical protein
MEKKKKRNKSLKWLLYGSLFFSFYILPVPAAVNFFNILFRAIPGLIALTTAIYLRKYKLGLLAILSLCLNMGSVYMYPKYVTSVVERRAALERSALEKEKHFGHLGDEALKIIKSQREDVAAQKVLEFIDICIIEQDFVAGYKFLDEKARIGITIKQFKDNIINLHSGIYPEYIEATDYEPILGGEAMKIFLCGKNGDKKFYYMITVVKFYKKAAVGTRYYKILDVELSLRPYPYSNLRCSLKN